MHALMKKRGGGEVASWESEGVHTFECVGDDKEGDSAANMPVALKCREEDYALPRKRKGSA